MDDIAGNEHQALIDQRNEAQAQVRRAAFALASVPWCSQYAIPESFRELQTAIDHLAKVTASEKERKEAHYADRWGGGGSPAARRMKWKGRRARRHQHLVKLREMAEQVEGMVDQMATTLREMAQAIGGLDDLDAAAGGGWSGSRLQARQAMKSFPTWISQKLSAFGCPALIAGPLGRFADSFPDPLERELLRSQECPWIKRRRSGALRCTRCGDKMPTNWMSHAERDTWFIARHEDCRPAAPGRAVT